MRPSYLFILCPPFSGSTLLWKLVATSDAVSALPNEGQFLPELEDVMRRDPWNVDLELPWPRIKAVWDGYWDHGRPLLLEKSPPNLIRTDDILQHFAPVHFLVMVRNPYALCEGLMRRNQWSATFAADFSIRVLRRQAEHAENLASSLSFTYEDLVADPEAVARRIEAFLPQITKLDPGRSFEIHSIDGVLERGIVDLNQKKIARLSGEDLAVIHRVLKPHADVMEYWGYDYLPSKGADG